MQTTLRTRLGLVSLVVNLGLVAGQIDPTDIANWPECAQICIPLGYRAPANCGSLSNIDCICKNPDFTLSLADCEQNTCTYGELDQITKLTNALCAPVGGLGPAVSTAVAGYFSTYAGSPSTPVIVAPTPTPDLGNTSDLNVYPACDQQCAYQARAVYGCVTGQLSCLCSPIFRAVTAACVEYNCTVGEELRTDQLVDQFCGPLYIKNASLSASVKAAIASATKSAKAVISATASAALAADNGTNGSVTAPNGAPTPSSFTGGAATVSDWGFTFALMVVVTSVGVLALGL
ncbi:hypothetical protein G7Y79_00047g083450 [Physcia stellaris]|nr:hypothetical protein G7Y79_00047g083450 [Physcia stellaris]